MSRCSRYADLLYITRIQRFFFYQDYVRARSFQYLASDYIYTRRQRQSINPSVLQWGTIIALRYHPQRSERGIFLKISLSFHPQSDPLSLHGKSYRLVPRVFYFLSEVLTFYVGGRRSHRCSTGAQWTAEAEEAPSPRSRRVTICKAALYRCTGNRISQSPWYSTSYQSPQPPSYVGGRRPCRFITHRAPFHHRTGARWTAEAEEAPSRRSR